MALLNNYFAVIFLRLRSFLKNINTLSSLFKTKNQNLKFMFTYDLSCFFLSLYLLPSQKTSYKCSVKLFTKVSIARMSLLDTIRFVESLCFPHFHKK